jgi:hypothetical protein
MYLPQIMGGVKGQFVKIMRACRPFAASLHLAFGLGFLDIGHCFSAQIIGDITDERLICQSA